MKLFISYRRSDSEGHAGWLYDQLTRAFSPSDVFFDVTGIAPGMNFVDTLEKKLSETDVMLVVIGPTWLTASDEAGRRRLDDPQDFVRREIATALKRAIGIIPILVGTMSSIPQAQALPDDLASLAHQQAIWLRHTTFGEDVQRLIASIKELRQPSSKRRLTDVAASIVEQYNQHFTLGATGEDYKLQLFFGSEHTKSSLFASYLLRDALVHLIDEADVSGWEKHPDEELQPDVFWASILGAVARSHRSAQVAPLEGDKSNAAILHDLIDWLDRKQIL